MSASLGSLPRSVFEEVNAPSLGQIKDAAERIRPYAVVTPLLENQVINEMCGGRVLFKPENLQVTGSFKFRGACNRLLQFSAEQKAAGVVAASSGNHALAMSTVAKLLGIKATILMPSDAPKTKIEGVCRNGATVRLYDRKTDDREAIAAEIARPTGAVTVPAYNDPYIMTGQGTVGLEIMQATLQMGIIPDVVLAACSGGGLVAGVASAVRAISAGTAVYAVEPAEFDDLARSLASGQRESNPAGASSICDGLEIATPGTLTFPINQRLLAGSLTATDDEVREAMRAVYANLKLVVEPSGVICLAAVLSKKIDIRGKTSVVVLSGGNVDADVFAAIIHP